MSAEGIVAEAGYFAIAVVCLVLVVLALPSVWNFGIYLVAMFSRLKKRDTHNPKINSVVDAQLAKPEVAPVALQPNSAIDSTSPLSFAVIVCAHNEEAVITRCVQSILGQNHPRFTCYVIADNCTDNTARAAADAGAIVLERASKNASSKGQALTWGIKNISANQTYDALCIFDADNVVETGFLTEVEYFLTNGYDAVSGQRITSNAEESLISALYSAYWNMTVMQSAPHAAFGLNALASGTGFAFRSDALPSDWQARTMTEDSEMCIQLGLDGKRIAYCPTARCHEPQTTRLRAMLRQQWRWQTGGLQLVRTYFVPAFRKFFAQPNLRAWDTFMLVVQLLAPLVAIGCLICCVVAAATRLWSTLSLCILATIGAFSLFIGLFAVTTDPARSRHSCAAVLCYPLFLAIMGAVELFSCFRPATRW